MSIIKFHGKTLRFQLTTILMLIALIALSTSFFAYTAFQYINLKKQMLNNTKLLANIISDNSNTALAFDDAEDAKVVLSSLRNSPAIDAACLYNSEGLLFTSYFRKGLNYSCPESSVENYRFDLRSLRLFHKITFDNKKIGTLFVDSNMSNLYSYLSKALIFSIFITFIALLIAYLLSQRLQSKISRPILQLIDMTMKYRETGVYKSQGQYNHAPAEVVTLFSSLTHLIKQIDSQRTERDLAEQQIIELNESLEKKVIQRTKELAETQKSLVQQAHQAGMAEVATGVLHNVGNVLNSVNISAQLISNKIKDSKISGFHKAIQLIEEHHDDLETFIKEDPKGQKILPYINNLADHTLSDHQNMEEEVASLVKNIEHIKQIVAMQQSFAKQIGFQEEEDLVDLIDNALEINLAALDRHNVTVDKNISKLPKIKTDRRKVLQILINLVSNAKYAMDNLSHKDRIMSIFTALEENGMIAIHVKDNGMGIKSENLAKIFQHGFTTRDDGHGFGLHSAAIAAKELGGELEVKSAGEKQGAEFILKLPLVLDRTKNKI